MPSSKALHPGAQWRFSDLQVHTPRDPGWIALPTRKATDPIKDELPGGTPTNENLRNAWAEAFVKECLAKGLSAIAITDHHDLCLIPYVQAAIKKLGAEDQLWLFPGMEVTCNDAAQCLVLFDVDADLRTLQRLFGKLPKVKEPPQNDPKAPQAQACGKNLEQFIDEIVHDASISARSIVLPHASDKGHKSVLVSGMQERFKALPVDGFYAEKPFDELDGVTKQKIYGDIKEWGGRRRGLVVTGDSRSGTYERLGKHLCWIKLGEPTAESLRQAFLADRARIVFSKPGVPSQRILRVEISSDLTGANFECVFNDGYTALIGGRGSGKSAILEYLRFGLGRSTVDVVSPEDSGYRRERELVSDTLGAGGHVAVTLERDGVLETWTRSWAQRGTITVNIEGQTPEQITIEASQERFRARAFSQKQLSTLVSDSARAAQQITGIAAAEAVDKRQSLERSIERAKLDVREAVGRLVRYWSATDEAAAASASVRDLTRRIDATNNKLKTAGLSEESQALLREAPAYQNADSLIEEARANVESEIESIRQLELLSWLDGEGWSDAEKFAEIKEFVSEVKKLRTGVEAAIANIEATLEEAEALRSKVKAQFRIRYEKFSKEHARASAQQQSLKTQIEELEKLTRELKLATASERKAEISRKTFEDAPQKLQAARAALSKLSSNRRELLKEEANRVSSKATGNLIASVESESVPAQFIAALSGLCENQRVKVALQRCEDRVRDLTLAGEKWEKLGDRLLDVLRSRMKQGANADPDEATRNELDEVIFQLTPQQQAGIFRAIDQEKIAFFLTATPEDFISFSYQDVSGKIPFEQASPGQQAAALLNLLLRQESGTLIIDQPEDDLDSKVIMNIVELVTTSKSKRQLVFATHNANFVVNGDADKVIALAPGVPGTSASSRISVETDGAIETPSIRSVITDTVEGGRTAFELRSRKYGFD
jgi:chromosome segregation protein